MNKPSQSPSPVPSTSSSKLPKFLRTNPSSTRDRAKSIAESSTSSLASTSSEGSSKPRKSRFLPRRSADVSSPPPAAEEPLPVTSSTDTDPPIIVEPVAIPRLRRTLSPSPPSSPSISPPRISLYSSTPGTSASRLTDLPTRLSGWFSHTFSTSTTDLSLPSLLASTSSASSSSHFAHSTSTVSPGTSPKRSTGTNALLAAAKHGKGHIDKAMRYLLDSDATPDKCTDPIWILGVKHPGWEPPTPSSTTAPLSPSLSSSTRSMRSSVSSASDATQAQGGGKPGSAQWPPVFYADFTSRIWLTYRSHFTPIRDVRLGDLDGVVDPASSTLSVSVSGSAVTTYSSDKVDVNVKGRKERAGDEGSSSPVIGRRPWTWGGSGAGAEKGWTTDSGWGCMLRTGQSLLANALVHLHLGRDWRRPPHPIPTADYATYVRILTWFLDTPAPEAPFSVHRMALAGKELGKDVGQWFGPSTAAGAIKTLVNSFPDAGLGVVVATDGVLFQSEVFSASHTNSATSVSARRHQKSMTGASWGDRPVLLLIGVRLGLDGVNPIYYETIKMLYTFPQSVGIAGGRPSSSYYFVGSQADNLFYLDPHHARPAVPLRPAPPPPSTPPPPSQQQTYRSYETETTPDEADAGNTYTAYKRNTPPNRAATNSPSSVRTGSSTFSYHAPLSPSPLQQEFSTSGESTMSTESSSRLKMSIKQPRPRTHPNAGRFRSASVSASPTPSEVLHENELRMSTGGGVLDPEQEHYVTAYSAAELKTYHCERIRKMPLSGLDPSMLIGFVCRDEGDWEDFRRRVGELPKAVFSVQEEPPSWPSDVDDNMGLESFSEHDPDDLLLDMDDEKQDEEDDETRDEYFDTRSASASTSTSSVSRSGSVIGRSTNDELDTEEDPVDPVTPLPNSRFTIVPPPTATHTRNNDDGEENKREMFEDDDDDDDDDDIEDDWVDPSVPTPISPGPTAVYVSPVAATTTPTVRVVPAAVHGHANANPKMPNKTNRKGRKEVPVPVPLVKVSTPSSVYRSSSQGQQQQEHYPFPVTDEVSPPRPEHRLRHTSISNKGMMGGKRMHTARARDGGRTQSGGVKGILTDDRRGVD